MNINLVLECIQREAVEALIQELPKFRLKAVPTDCSECPICLEEFHVGNEVNISLFQHVLIETSVVQVVKFTISLVWYICLCIPQLFKS